MLTKLKKTVQLWLTAEARLMHKTGLTPNMLSTLGVILGVASGVVYWAAGIFFSIPDFYLYRIYLFLAIIFLSASGLCDALDGTLARLYGKTSILGGFLDSLLDRYVEASVYCGLILGGLSDSFWGLLALIGSLLTSYTRARSEAADVPMETVGVIERAERLIIIGIATILSLVWPETSALRWGIILLALATNLTVLQRVIYFYRKAGSSKTN
ncbi:MAG: CDP-alcohol phosphatidyltransferase family protein [Candidatus Bathyarchaeia archaeon]